MGDLVEYLVVTQARCIQEFESLLDTNLVRFVLIFNKFVPL
jgi:hypothetical protein